MFVDYILDGRAHGEVAEQLAGCRFDPGLLRPYKDERGRNCCTINTGRVERDKDTGLSRPVLENHLITDLQARGIDSPVFNATSLRKDEWIELDRVLIKAARERLRAWSDLAAANTFGGFDGMAKSTLEWETMSDPGEAIVDMDGITDGRGDSPLFQLESIPLPITHSSFSFSKRRLMTSRNSGTPLDTTMGEAASRRVSEEIEKTLIGVSTGITYGVKPSGARQTSTVYGYTNFPDRITKTDMTAPTGTNGTTILGEWLALRQLLVDKKFYGPYMAYVSSNYAQFLDDEFKTNSDRSLRERLLAIESISGIRTLDFLTTSDVVIFVQMTSDVARAVVGMDITTVQWESKGGMQLNFKVMAILVPQLRADHAGNAGIAHGTTS